MRYPRSKQQRSVIVDKGSALAELVVVGERFERAEIPARIFAGLELLARPEKEAAPHMDKAHVRRAIRWISSLPDED